MTITTGYGDALTFDLPPNRLTITSPPYANQRRKQHAGAPGAYCYPQPHAKPPLPTQRHNATPTLLGSTP